MRTYIFKKSIFPYISIFFFVMSFHTIGAITFRAHAVDLSGNASDHIISDIQLKTIYIKRPEKFTNVFFSTPIFYGKDIFFSTPGTIWIISDDSDIEVEIGDTMISEPIVFGGEFIFCSLHSKVIKFGLLGISEELELEFPCVTSPLPTKHGIYTVDMLGNVCLFPRGENQIGKEEKKCVDISDEEIGFTQAVFVISSPLRMYLYEGNILVPYRNKIVVLSPDLRLRYPLAEFEKTEFITSFEVVGEKALITTQNTVYMYFLKKRKNAIFPELIFSYEIGEISGGDFDGEKAVITTKDGILLITEKGKGKFKKISGIFDISSPKLYGNTVIFTASFGQKLGKAFSPRKNSLVIARAYLPSKEKIPEIKILKEIIINGFANSIAVQNGKVGLITDNGTLYVFKMILRRK